MSDTQKRPTRDPALIARLCERVYRRGLDRNGDAMVERDGDDGTKLRRRSMAYASLVRATLDALDEEHPTPQPDPEARFAAMLRAGWLPITESAA